MLISIIIPVYNVEAYIKECILSVINQTYLDIECILVDDCGQDNSIAIAKQVISEYSGPIEFFIISHDINKGLSAARNSGINLAKGEYLYFLDSDDSICHDCIEKLVKLAHKYPGVDMVTAGAESSDGSQWLSMSRRTDYPEYTEDKTWIKSMMLLENIQITSWNHLLRTSIIRENGMSFLEGILNEDALWNNTLAKHLNKIAFCKEDTYNYLVREGSIQTNPDLAMKRWKSKIRILNEYIDNFDAFLENEQKFIAFMRIITYYTSFEEGQIEDIILLLRKLRKKCVFRQKIAVDIAINSPISILRNSGIFRRFIFDIFGQFQCRRFVDFGLRYYLKCFQ